MNMRIMELIFFHAGRKPPCITREFKKQVRDAS